MGKIETVKKPNPNTLERDTSLSNMNLRQIITLREGEWDKPWTSSEVIKKMLEKEGLPMIKELGSSPRIIANKVFAFHTQEQMNAKYDWGLKLYREMLHEITGASIIFSQAVEKEKRDMKELGGQDNL